MPQPPYGSKNQPGPDWSELPLQKRKCKPPPAELLDRPFNGREAQRHEQCLKGRKWERFREKVPSKRGSANEDQRNANDQKSIPSCAASPEQSPSEEAPQTGDAAVAGNKRERRDCRCVHGQEEERMVAGELAKRWPHKFREEDVQSKDTPSYAKRDQQKGSK